MCLWPAPPAQIINLPDGQAFRLVGVTWGTNHSEPRVLARVVDTLPAKLADFVRAKLKPRSDLHPPVVTSTPKLLVWLEPVGTNWTNATLGWAINARLTGENGVASGGNSGIGGSGATAQWMWLQFPVVPRRSRLIRCDLSYSSVGMQPGSGTNADIHISLPNPRFGHFDQWQPEPLPAMKSIGDVQVRLDQVDPGLNFSVSILSNGKSNSGWQVESAELSDATGNSLQPGGPFKIADGRFAVPALWPGESAWKLKLGLRRTAGFAASELTTFSNVPVFLTPSGRPVMAPFPGASTLTNLFGGASITLLNAPGLMNWAQPPFSDSYWVDLETANKPSDVAVDIVDVKTDAGDSLTPKPNANFGNWSFSPAPTNAKTLNISVAVQKLRYVEFLFAPPKFPDTHPSSNDPKF